MWRGLKVEGQGTAMQGRSPGLNTCPHTPLMPWIFSRAPVGQPTSGVWGKEACVCRLYKPASRDPEQAERGVGVSQGGPRRTCRTPCPTPTPGPYSPHHLTADPGELSMLFAEVATSIAWFHFLTVPASTATKLLSRCCPAPQRVLQRPA